MLRYLDPGRPATLDLTAEERAILEQVNQKVAAAESLPQITDFLFEALRGISPTDRVSLAFVEEDGQRIVSSYTRTNYEAVLLRPGYAEDLAGSSLRYVIESGRPRIINDLARYLQEHPFSHSTRQIVYEGIRSSMTCPLEVEGRKVGVLFYSSRQPNAYDDHQVQLHMVIAERLSQAVEKAYRIEKLDAANRAYLEMLGFVSHELKNPLAAMVTDGRLLAQGYVGELTPQQKEKVERMIDRGEYLLSLVREYLDLARIESGELKPDIRRDVEFIGQVVKPAIDMTEAQREARNMRLVSYWPDRPVLHDCDINLMRIVLVNLLGNAVKYGREGGMIRVTVREDALGLNVWVWNEGPGFTEAQKNLLFRKFSRLDTPAQDRERGTGVGLYSAWRILKLHHGRISAHSDPGRWAEFHFVLPARST
jgi:signal transduction histidine kinase